jgi:hypothetical protein
MILLLKLILAPIIIALVSLAGRKWGSSVGGWFLGFPLTSGPISIVMALQHGTGFAAASAAGNLGGQASVCVFCLVYGLTALRFNWLISAAAAISAFFASIFLLNQFDLTLTAAFIIILAVVVVVFILLPKSGGESKETFLPAWDLPARMLLAVVFVYGITTFADVLGPQLSGLIAPFPVFGLIMSIFTHQQSGSGAALKLFRSYVMSSTGYACFFLIVGLALPTLGIGWTYALATLAIFCLNGFTLFILQKTDHPVTG